MKFNETLLTEDILVKRMRIYQIGLHQGEEPFVVGNHRAGMVVMSGCHLACTFCYTPETSVHNEGQDLTSGQLRNAFDRLRVCGAENINIISPTQSWSALRECLETWTKQLPVVLKSSGYESPNVVKGFAEKADVWVPDFKVASSSLGSGVGLPGDYARKALEAIEAAQLLMEAKWNNHQLIRGIVVRHLLMPECDADSKQVIRLLAAIRFGGVVNLMTQFVSRAGLKVASERRVNELVDLGEQLGLGLAVNGRLVGKGYDAAA